MNHNPTVQLAKVQRGPKDSHADATDLGSVTTNVVVEARLLVPQSAFLGHSFLPQDAHVVSFFRDILNEMLVRCISGEKPEVEQVHEKVKKRIREASIFVALFTRRDKIEGKDVWRTTEWVIQEMAYAAANGKKLLLLKENGIDDIGGLHGNQEYIEFNRDSLHLSAPKLLQSLWSLNPGRLKIQTNKPPELGIDILRMAADATPGEPTARIILAQQLQKSGQLHSAIREIDEVLAKFSAYAPALYVKAQILRAGGKKQDAKVVLTKLADISPNDANVHHELAHVLSELGEYNEADREFEIAETCALGVARHYKCHGDLLVRMANRRPVLLKRALELYETAQELGDQILRDLLKKQATAVKRQLSRLPGNGKSVKSRNAKKRPR
jgi:tetratricopeptide (TPR) repeat protein